MMLDFAASWVEVPEDPKDDYYPRYPKESLVDWHERLGLIDKACD